MLITRIHKYIHTYIHVLLKKRKNNFFVDKYVGARLYRKIIDAGSFCSTYKKLLRGGLLWIKKV